MAHTAAGIWMPGQALSPASAQAEVRCDEMGNNLLVLHYSAALDCLQSLDAELIGLSPQST